MQFRVIFALPLWCPPLLVPWAAAPIAYPSIHHWLGLDFGGNPDHVTLRLGLRLRSGL